MESKRLIRHAPKTTDVMGKVAALEGPCIGCRECTGLCVALLEALTIPEMIVRADG